ncbi:NicO-domain-containing protein [Pisolithus sp. B1]|nr:NicO-domain-containing protein [Pisolithus sp. B1]
MDGATRLSGLFFSLTVFGRSFFLILLLLLFNAVCWGVAAGCYTLLDLSMLAWYAIDNATRTLISRGQLPVTCGFYFSLGHSTIVIAANLAIVISTSVYNKLSAFNNLASVIGTSISASFLFIVGLANSIILWRIIRQRRMYPVGVLFGLVALLALSALAQQDDGGNRIRPSSGLGLLFTGGMTLVDSLNSIMMLYSYSVEDGDVSRDPDLDMTDTPDQTRPEWITHSSPTAGDLCRPRVAGEGYHVACAKRHTLSNLSILLTSMSILLAFSIAIIEIMGLIGQVCASCQRTASAADGGGLAGKWWRAWQRANDNSGYIGAAVVGVFLLVVIGWFSVKRITKTRQISLGENESLGSRMYEDNMETRGVGA